MELVTKLDVILMLIGIVGTTAQTTSDKNETSSNVTSDAKSSTQNTTVTTTDEGQKTKTPGKEDVSPNTALTVQPSTQDTTVTTTDEGQKTKTPGKDDISPNTALTVQPSTQDTTMTETTMTTPGNGQESKKCENVFIFGGVGVALTIPITVIITLLLIWRRIGVGPLISCTRSDAHYSSVECNLFVKWAQFSRSIRVCWEFLLLSICCCLKSIGTGPRKEELTGSDQVPRIVPDRNGAEQSNNADERDYDQPQWNRIALSVHRQPIGNEMENTEYENVGSCSRSSYEGLHPYENHGMNLYDSCSQEYILQEETEETLV